MNADIKEASTGGVKDQAFLGVIEALPDAVVVIGRQGRLHFANAAARRLLASGDGTLPPTPLGLHSPAESTKFCFLAADGQRRVLQVRACATEWESEPAWVATLRDVSSHEMPPEGIEALLTHSPALIYAKDAAGRYTLANRRFASAAGLTVEQVLGRTDAELFSPGLAQRFSQYHKCVVEKGESVTFEVLANQADGEHAYLCHEFPLLDALGKIYAAGGTRIDTTDRTRAEQRLEQSQAGQQAIIESSLDCVVVMDARERILEFNAAAERTFGYGREEVLGQPMIDMLIAPAMRDSFRASLRRCLENRLQRLFDKRVEMAALRKGGAEFSIEMAVSVSRHDAEPIFTAVLHEITQRLQAHQELVLQTRHLEQAVAALERVRERERQVLASIPSIFIGLDDDGKVTHFNPAAEKQFGMAIDQVVGRSLAELEIGWPAESIAESIALCRKLGEAVRIDELRVADSKGRERILTLTMNRTESRDDKAGVVVSGTDITDRKSMETQLMLAQKMESIGQLAAGIAHEINTPTQYVSDNTRFLQDAFEDFRRVMERYERACDEARNGLVSPSTLDQVRELREEVDLAFLAEEIPKAIGQSLEGLNRVAEIVRAMKQFSHPDQDEPELTDLNKAIENTVTVARNEWKYVAEMELDLDPHLPAVSCLAGRFNQVILNLIVNAAHAIADVVGDAAETKGSIRITTRRAGDQAEIRVADTGTGIKAKIRNRIFDPFFTTKQVGKGTGQGLAIAHSIVVEQHGGAIDLESEEGKGTTFILRLPLKRVEQPPEVST